MIKLRHKVLKNILKVFTMIDSYNLSSSKEYYIPLYVFETLLKKRTTEYINITFKDNWLDAIKIDYLSDKINSIVNKKVNPTLDVILNDLSLGNIVEIFQYKHRKYTKLSGLLTYVFQTNRTTSGSKIYQQDMYNKIYLIAKLRNDVFHFRDIIRNQKYSNITKTINGLIYRMDHTKEIVNELEHKFNLKITQPPQQ